MPVTASSLANTAIASDGEGMVHLSASDDGVGGSLTVSNNNEVTDFRRPRGGQEIAVGMKMGARGFVEAEVATSLGPPGWDDHEAGRTVKDLRNTGLRSAFGIPFPEDQSVWRHEAKADNMVSHLTRR